MFFDQCEVGINGYNEENVIFWKEVNKIIDIENFTSVLKTSVLTCL